MKSKVGALSGSRAGYSIKFGGIILLLWLTLIMFKGKATIVIFLIKN